MIPKERFKNSMGNLIQKGLFLETNTTLENRALVVYTLKDRDKGGYPSIQRIYLDAGDPTEYQFALDNFYSWDHWQRIAESDWFQPYISKWRKELEARLKAEALNRIMAKAKGEGKDSFQANKYLLERTWSSPKKKVGRPVTEEVLEPKEDYSEDYNRLFNSNEEELTSSSDQKESESNGN